MYLHIIYKKYNVKDTMRINIKAYIYLYIVLDIAKNSEKNGGFKIF